MQKFFIFLVVSIFLFSNFSASGQIRNRENLGPNSPIFTTGNSSVIDYWITRLSSINLRTNASIKEYRLWGVTYYLIEGDDEMSFMSMDVRPLLVKPITNNSFQNYAHFYLSDVMTESNDLVPVLVYESRTTHYKLVSFYENAIYIRTIWEKKLPSYFCENGDRLPKPIPQGRIIIN